jgi:hypothetical protein
MFPDPSQTVNIANHGVSAVAKRQKVVAQFRRGNRGPRRATQPLVLRLPAISAPRTSAGRVQKRRGRVRAFGARAHPPRPRRAERPVITVQCRPLPETRTSNSACAWLAECEVDGRRFNARSRHGAPNALARELVAAGIPDDALEIHFEGLAGTMRYPSFHAAAGWTFSESASTPLRRVPFREFDLDQGEPFEGPARCTVPANIGVEGPRV